MDAYKLFQIKLNKHFQKLSNNRRKCSHPNCNERAIKSHTVSKASNLLKISSKNNKIYSIRNPIFGINNNNFIDFGCGINEASVYPLFCTKHDANLFEPFEKNNILYLEQIKSLWLRDEENKSRNADLAYYFHQISVKTNFEFIKELLSYYIEQTEFKIKSNTDIFSDLLKKKYNASHEDIYQELENGVTLFPSHYFSLDVPKNFVIHHPPV